MNKSKVNELAEMYVMTVRGEFSQENFLKAFYARFPKEITRVVNRRRTNEGYGWNAIDWDKLEQHPLLSQLLT